MALITVCAVLALTGASAAVEVMPLAEVVPGSSGVCITEMDGGELVKVPLTVIGTLGPSAPDRDLILVRLEDPRFKEVGIIAGMSGSPVYVDGRLLGALAFGWQFSLEPIAGVTPFEQMRDLGAAAPPATAAGAIRPRLTELVAAAHDGTLGDRLLDWLVPAAGGGLDRLPLAVSFGGRRPDGDGWLAESWRRLGWVGTPAAATTGDQPNNSPLVPGSMVAAVLVDGDAVVAAGGTVTEVQGDQVWAFGHPYLGGGSARIPMASARAVAVLPSLASSFKFFEVGQIIGAFETDRTHGVWGRIGGSAPMVPIDVRVDDRAYSFRAVRHDILLPLMVSYLTNSSIAAHGRSFGDSTVSLRLEIDYPGERTVRYGEAFSGGQSPPDAAGMAGAVVAYLMNSPFEGPVVEALRIRLDTSERISSATVVDAVPERTVVHPGEELSVRIRLRPHRGTEYDHTVSLRIPDEVPEGRLDLVVADGGSWTAYDLQMRPFIPASFDDEIRYLGRLVPTTTLVLALESRQTGVAFQGGALAVPPSVVVQMRSALGPYLRTTEYGIWNRIQEEMPTSVVGAQRIPLTVRVSHWEDE